MRLQHQEKWGQEKKGITNGMKCQDIPNLRAVMCGRLTCPEAGLQDWHWTQGRAHRSHQRGLWVKSWAGKLLSRASGCAHGTQGAKPGYSRQSIRKTECFNTVLGAIFHKSNVGKKCFCVSLIKLTAQMEEQQQTI